MYTCIVSYFVTCMYFYPLCRSNYVSIKRKEQVWGVVGRCYTAVHYRVMNKTRHPPTERQFYSESDLGNPLLLEDGSFGLHDVSDSKDETSYREELVVLEKSTSITK